jgi:LysM repeat protein
MLARGELPIEGFPSREDAIRQIASLIPRGPQDVTFFADRGETLALYAEWSGLPTTAIAVELGTDADVAGGDIEPVDPQKELPRGAPVTLRLSAEEYDRTEQARKAWHQAYRDAFDAKYEVRNIEEYVVSRGDSPWKLRHLGDHPVPLWMLEDLNSGQTFDILHIGDRIRVPVLAERATSEAPRVDRGQGPLSPPPAAAEEEPPQASGLAIRVQPGETLAMYAQWADVPLQAVLAANPGVDPRGLRVGQALTIPARDSQVSDFYRLRKVHQRGLEGQAAAPRVSGGATVHVVEAGDAAWKIAKRHEGITLEALRDANPGVDLDRLRPGDLLQIPPRAAR